MQFTGKIMKIPTAFQAFSAPQSRKIAIASDHAGFRLKELIKNHLSELGYEYKDFGTINEDPVDYSDFAYMVGEEVSKNNFERGILICGTGLGMCIVANKLHGTRAVSCHNIKTAKLSRKHNDSNILTLGGRTMSPESAKKIVSVWLTTEFEGGRHERRINKIKAIEDNSMKA